jgi:hypothetical protein
MLAGALLAVDPYHDDLIPTKVFGIAFSTTLGQRLSCSAA